MSWTRVVVGIVSVAIAGAACSTNESSEGFENGSAPTTSSAASNNANDGFPLVGDEPDFELRAIEVGVDANAPNWCERLLSEAVRTLPSAVNAIGEPSMVGEVDTVLNAAAADVLAASASAEANVAVAGEELAAALTRIDPAAPDPDDTVAVADALDEFGVAVGVCGFS